MVAIHWPLLLQILQVRHKIEAFQPAEVRVGFFSTLIYSWKKSSRLRKLELRIAGTEQITAEYLLAGRTDSDQALAEFFDLCEADQYLKKLMEVERLTRADLEEVYWDLMKVGCGQWVKGHYVALSSIAYVEPLLYIVRSKRQTKEQLQEIGINLLDY